MIKKRKVCFVIGCCTLLCLTVRGGAVFPLESIGLYPPTFNTVNSQESTFKESSTFDSRSLVLQIGYGHQLNVDMVTRVLELNQLDITSLVPPVTLKLDVNVFNNLSIGVSAGTSIWKVPVLNYQYRYLTGGLHTAYHFNIIDFLDPYVSGALSYKRIEVPNENQKLSQWTVTSSFLVGIRVFLSRRIGGFVEVGNDAMTHYKFGIALHIG